MFQFCCGLTNYMIVIRGPTSAAELAWLPL